MAFKNNSLFKNRTSCVVAGLSVAKDCYCCSGNFVKSRLGGFLSSASDGKIFVDWYGTRA